MKEARCWTGSQKPGTEMPGISEDAPALLAEARRKKPREVGLLEWMYYVKPEGSLKIYVPQEGPEDSHTPRPLGTCWRGHSASPRHSVVAHRLKSRSMVGETLAQLGWLISMRIMGPRVREAWCWHLTACQETTTVSLERLEDQPKGLDSQRVTVMAKRLVCQGQNRQAHSALPNTEQKQQTG